MGGCTECRSACIRKSLLFSTANCRTCWWGGIVKLPAKRLGSGLALVGLTVELIAKSLLWCSASFYCTVRLEAEAVVGEEQSCVANFFSEYLVFMAAQRRCI